MRKEATMSDTMFILTESIDEGVMRMWHFRVVDHYEMAHMILDNLSQYDADMFNGISWCSGLARWRRSENRTPQSLLNAIANSHIDGDSESGFQIHRIDLAQNGKEGEEVTWKHAEIT